MLEPSNSPESIVFVGKPDVPNDKSPAAGQHTFGGASSGISLIIEKIAGDENCFSAIGAKSM
jgi:hypothetical protein